MHVYMFACCINIRRREKRVYCCSMDFSKLLSLFSVVNGAVCLEKETEGGELSVLFSSVNCFVHLRLSIINN